MIDRNSHESDIHVEEINSGNIAFAVADKGVIRDNDNVNLIEKVITIPDDWKLPNPKDTSGNEQHLNSWIILVIGIIIFSGRCIKKWNWQ